MGQARERKLGRGITDGIGARHGRRHAADVDDAAALLHLHDFHGFAAGDEGRGQVGIDDVAPFLGGDFGRGLVDRDAGVIHENVETAKLVHGRLDHVQDVGFLGHVGWADEGGAALLVEFGGELFKFVLAACGQHGLDAFGGQPARNGLAQT